MTLRITLGIDPGQTGAIAVLADGKFDSVIDMPTIERKAGGMQVDATRLCLEIKEALSNHPGAYVYGVIELVASRPGQGSTGMFRFGQSDGIARGVLGAMRISLIEVPPVRWKRYLQLIGMEKDAAREMAMNFYPAAAHLLKRKKDCGRADALMIATWAERTEQVARRDAVA